MNKGILILGINAFIIVVTMMLMFYTDIISFLIDTVWTDWRGVKDWLGFFIFIAWAIGHLCLNVLITIYIYGKKRKDLGQYFFINIIMTIFLVFVFFCVSSGSRGYYSFQYQKIIKPSTCGPTLN